MKDEFLFYEEGAFVSEGDNTVDMFLMETSPVKDTPNNESWSAYNSFNNTTLTGALFDIESVFGPKRGELYKTIIITVTTIMPHALPQSISFGVPRRFLAYRHPAKARDGRLVSSWGAAAGWQAGVSAARAQ